MSYVKPKGLGQEETHVHRIRITLTSRNVKNLEKGRCRELKPGFEGFTFVREGVGITSPLAKGLASDFAWILNTVL